MDAEKEQADSLRITMVHSYASLETNFVQPNTVGLRVPSQFSTILFRSERSEEKGQESKRVSKESYERNDKIKPLLSVVSFFDLSSDTFLRLFCVPIVRDHLSLSLSLDETENLKCKRLRREERHDFVVTRLTRKYYSVSNRFSDNKLLR